MVRSATFETVAGDVTEAVSAASGHARDAAHKVAAEGSDALRSAAGASRTIFHDLAEAAEARLAEQERSARRYGAIVAREVQARPGLTLFAVASVAALAASFAGWALSRRR